MCPPTNRKILFLRVLAIKLNVSSNAALSNKMKTPKCFVMGDFYLRAEHTLRHLTNL